MRPDSPIELEYDLTDRELSLTDCWVNVMPPGVSHSLHLHPLSTLSGTYYVRTPRGAPGLKFEDPRLSRFMAAPPKRADAAERPWVVLPARAGELLLFESWLRHEVVANSGRDAAHQHQLQFRLVLTPRTRARAYKHVFAGLPEFGQAPWNFQRWPLGGL